MTEAGQPDSPTTQDIAHALLGRRMGQKSFFIFSNEGSNYSIVDLSVMNNDGSGLTRLTNRPAHNLLPRWSPDGTKIVFQSVLAGNQEIHVMNADGSGVTRLTKSLGDKQNLVWSPEGTRVAFPYDWGGNGNHDIFVVNVDGSGLTNFTNSPGDDSAPNWSLRKERNPTTPMLIRSGSIARGFF